MKTILAILTAVAMTGLSTAAVYAQDVATAKVGYTDLNLTTKSGINALSARVQHAANKVCGVGESNELAARMASEKCRRQAVADAMAQVATRTTPTYASR